MSSRYGAMSAMLLLKLTLGPLLVATATLATRKWGPRAGGLLMGLPLTTGPIFLLMALELGPRFAAAATAGILCGLVGLSAFAVVYAFVSARRGWVVSLACASAAFLVVSAAVGRSGIGTLIAGLAAGLALSLGLWLIPRPTRGAIRSSPPWWDLWARMAAVAGLTLLATTLAARIGPVAGGIIGTYPVMMTVVVPFTHVQFGQPAAVAMLRASLLLWYGFASCFLAIGLGIAVLGMGPAVALGVLATVSTSACALWVEALVARPPRATHLGT